MSRFARKFKPMKFNTIIKRIFIIFLVCSATLAYLEFGVRILAGSAFPLLRNDPEVGSIHVRNFSGLVWDGDSQRNNFIITNSWGYIGKDYNLSNSPTTLRIAVLGDSVTAALQVDYLNNFSSQLETALNVSGVCGKKVEVLNYGVGGAGTFLEYQTYKKYVAPFKSDVVLLVFHDDFDENINKSNFDPENYAAERKAVGLKALLLDFDLPKFIFSKLQSNTLVINSLKFLGIFESADLSVASGTLATAEPQSYFNYTFDLIQRFNDRIRADGGKLIVAIYPPDRDYGASGAWKNDSHVSKLADFLTASKIESINLSDGLARAKAAHGVCLTFGCGEHLTEYGHQAVASILYNYLSADSLCQ